MHGSWSLICVQNLSLFRVCLCHLLTFTLQLQQYQYYSAGLLSTYDPYYEQQRHLLGPKKKKFKEEKKIKGKVINLVFLNGCWGLTSFLHCFLWLNINVQNFWVSQGNTKFWQRKMSSENTALYYLASRKLGWKKGCDWTVHGLKFSLWTLFSGLESINTVSYHGPFIQEFFENMIGPWKM